MTAISLPPMAWAIGLPIFWGFLGLGFWILLIALIVLLVRGTGTARASGGPAIRVLEERYARGEITREEFLERRAVLGGPSAGVPDDGSR
jgi:putative membrane protein